VSSLDRILPFLKPIEDLLLDPAITEVMVNEGGRRVFVEREGVLEGIPTELADAVAKVLRESQSDKESFVRSTTMRPQQQQLTIRAKLDRAYDDRLSGRIPDDLWTSKVSRARGATPKRSCGDGAPRAREPRLRAYRAANLRTRANRVFSLRYAESARTGAIAENATIELHLRSRNSLSHIQKAVRSVRARE
jgi:hypothetical protein